MLKTACLLLNIIIEEGLAFEDVGEDVQDTPLWQGVERNVPRANREPISALRFATSFVRFLIVLKDL